MKVGPRTLSKVLAFAAIVLLLLWSCRDLLRLVLFPENAYFTADTYLDLPERWRPWIPPEATAIRLRTYQSAYWITAESRCSESDAIRWAASIDHPLDSQWDIPALPDHSLPADQLGFIRAAKEKDRYIWCAQPAGSRTSLIFDRTTTTLYLMKNSG